VLLVAAVGGLGGACTDGTPTRYAPASPDGAGEPGGDSGVEPESGSGPGNPGINPAGDSPSSAKTGVDATVEAPPPRGPTPPTGGTNFPFPQNRQSTNCVYPSRYLNSDVQAAYAKWTSDTVTSSGANGFMRVQRLSSDQGAPAGSTVSEGIGYGMLIAVYMGDQNLFDNLWQYEQAHLDVNGLMNWNIGEDGSTVLGMGGATDADEDMAFALVMASHQWGQGSLSKSYSDIALTQIKAVWDNEILNYNLVLPGDMWMFTGASALNLSYFAPAYYRVFATLDPNTGSATSDAWMNALEMSYTTLNAALNATNGNQSNGLVPAWCSSSGAPNAQAFGPPPASPSPTNYQYDSCRTPFRIGLDWCWNAEPRAQAYVSLTSVFFSGIGAKNIVDGYALTGMPDPGTNPNSTATQSAAFIGPAGVGAMSSATYQSFVNDAYGELATLELLQGGTYYEDSWTTMSLLMMSANFLDYTNPAY
jgi:hypothetical protein